MSEWIRFGAGKNLYYLMFDFNYYIVATDHETLMEAMKIVKNTKVKAISKDGTDIKSPEKIPTFYFTFSATDLMAPRAIEQLRRNFTFMKYDYLTGGEVQANLLFEMVGVPVNEGLLKEPFETKYIDEVIRGLGQIKGEPTFLPGKKQGEVKVSVPMIGSINDMEEIKNKIVSELQSSFRDGQAISNIKEV